MARRRMVRYSRRRRGAGKRKIVKKMLRKRSKKIFKKRVKNVVKFMAEKKTAFYDAVNILRGRTDDADFEANNIQLLTPASAGSWNVGVQGTGAGQRVGNKIQVVKHIYKGIIYPYGTGMTKPTMIRMVICSPKVNANDNTTAMKAIFQTNCFQQGSTSIGLGAWIDDFIEAFNKDQLTVYKVKDFKIGTADTGQAAIQNYPNNDFKWMVKFRFNLKKIVPKIFKYNDATQTPSVNKNIYCVWYCAAVDGSVNGIGSTYARCHHYQLVNYIDI